MVRFFSKTFILLFMSLFSSSLWATDPLWIDVRSADEYNTGHVDGSVHIPYTEIEARISEVTRDKDAPVYVYCRSGRRSGIAKVTLQEAGFTSVVNAGSVEDARTMAAEVASQ